MGERAGIDGVALVRLIVDRLDESRRVATWILRDVQAAEDVVQEAAMLAWDRRRPCGTGTRPTPGSGGSW